MNDAHYGASLPRLLRLAVLTGAFVFVCGLPDSLDAVADALRALVRF